MFGHTEDFRNRAAGKRSQVRFSESRMASNRLRSAVGSWLKNLT